MHVLPPVLSGGEKQRAAIARALIVRPGAASRRRADRQRRPVARRAGCCACSSSSTGSAPRSSSRPTTSASWTSSTSAASCSATAGCTSTSRAHDRTRAPAPGARPSARRRAPLPAALGRNAPLVPVDSAGGRALVGVIAILTFLAALCAGGAELVARELRRSGDPPSRREVTIQVRPDAAARHRGRRGARGRRSPARTPGVERRGAFPSSTSPSACSSPGSAPASTSATCRCRGSIVMKLAGRPRPDFDAAPAPPRAEVPGATLDDHAPVAVAALDHGQHRRRGRRSALVDPGPRRGRARRRPSRPGAPWRATARSSTCCISSAPTTTSSPASSSAASSASGSQGSVVGGAARPPPDRASRACSPRPGGRAPTGDQIEALFGAFEHRLARLCGSVVADRARRRRALVTGHRARAVDGRDDFLTGKPR